MKVEYSRDKAEQVLSDFNVYNGYGETLDDKYENFLSCELLSNWYFYVRTHRCVFQVL
jgi:hypothetical protein